MKAPARRLHRPIVLAGLTVAAAAWTGLAALPVSAQGLGGFGRRPGGGGMAPPRANIPTAPPSSGPVFQAPSAPSGPVESGRIYAPPPRATVPGPGYNPPVFNPPSFPTGPIVTPGPSPVGPIGPGVTYNPSDPGSGGGYNRTPFPNGYGGGGTPFPGGYGRRPFPGGNHGQPNISRPGPRPSPPARQNPVPDGRSSYYTYRPPVRVTTPTGPRYLDRRHDRNYDNYVYGDTVITNGGSTIITNSPVLLGGYYYGNYCDTPYGGYTFPTIYSVYDGFPRYAYNPGVVVIGQPYFPVYTTPYLPFSPPTYQVEYNQNNYYVASPDRAADLQAGGDRAAHALKNAFPANSYQAAFADIERAWTEGSVALIRKHIRDNDTKLSVFLNRKYSYSIASGDFVQITRDALDRLNTVSFQLTRVRKAKNGDVTAYGKHVYRAGDADSGTDAASGSDTQSLDLDNGGSADSQSGQSDPYSKSNDPSSGQEKTVYVSYTLRHDRDDDTWYIIAIDSSSKPLVTSDSEASQ